MGGAEAKEAHESSPLWGEPETQPYSEEAGTWAMVPKSTTFCSHGEPRMGGRVSILVLSGGETGGRENIVLGRENRQEEGGRWGAGGEGTQSS